MQELMLTKSMGYDSTSNIASTETKRGTGNREVQGSQSSRLRTAASNEPMRVVRCSTSADNLVTRFTSAPMKNRIPVIWQIKMKPDKKITDTIEFHWLSFHKNVFNKNVSINPFRHHITEIIFLNITFLLFGYSSYFSLLTDFVRWSQHWTLLHKKLFEQAKYVTAILSWAISWFVTFVRGRVCVNWYCGALQPINDIHNRFILICSRWCLRPIVGRACCGGGWGWCGKATLAATWWWCCKSRPIYIREVWQRT